jgi:hypothetical protein
MFTHICEPYTDLWLRNTTSGATLKLNSNMHFKWTAIPKITWIKNEFFQDH